METVFGNSLFKCFTAAYYVVVIAVVNILAPGCGLEGIKVSPSKDSAPSPSMLSSVIVLLGLESPVFIDHSQQVSPPTQLNFAEAKQQRDHGQYPISLELPVGLFPATIITVNNDFSVNAVQRKIEQFEATDDVFD